jgi:hypothetical protein
MRRQWHGRVPQAIPPQPRARGVVASPIRRPLLVVSNEVSSTTTVYQVTGSPF